MSQKDEYFLGHRQSEQARLQAQADLFANESSWLFDQFALVPGVRVVEMGCGPRGSLDELALRVGDRGQVIGVDSDADTVELARTFVAEHGLANVEVRSGDARSTGLEHDGFDLVTSRLLLVNVAQPEEIVREAVALAKPGGIVAFHEADYLSFVCDPPLAAWDRAIELLTDYSHRSGTDLFIGRKLPRLLREAGLVDVQSRPLVYLWPAGHVHRAILPQFVENLSARLVDTGVVGPSELEGVQAALRRHLDDPDTLVVSFLFLQAWGRKP